MAEPSVAFVGLGAIGLPMARRLVGAGYPSTGVETSSAARERAAAAGVPAARSLAEVPTATIVVVASPAQRAELVTAALDGSVAGQRWIVMSTVGPDAVREQGSRLAEAGAPSWTAPSPAGLPGRERGT